MKKIFGVLLIIFGSFLEVYFYYFRFENEGLYNWLSIIIGISLTLLLCMAVINRERKNIKILILFVIIYSVLATSAGQSLFFGERKQQEIEQEIHEMYNQEDIEDLELQIKRLDDKYDQIQQAIEETAKTLHDRGLYRTALQNAEIEQQQIYDDREILRTELRELKSMTLTHKEIEAIKTNIYKFYSELTNKITPERWLQFIFQTILSIFIAIMAPLGIITLQQKEETSKEKKEPEKPKKLKKNWKQLIEKWVDINWMGVRSGKSNKLLPKKTYLEYVNKHGQKFTEKEYNIIYKSAMKTKCIDKNNKIMVDQFKAIAIINNYIEGD